MSRKEPNERAKNLPKPAKMSGLKVNAKRSKTTQNFEIEGICNFLLAFIFQILSPNARKGHFGPKSINFLILTKFSMYQICHLSLKILSPNAQILAFWAKNYWVSNLNEISHVPYSTRSKIFYICISY